jgi:hypothetical protein
MRVNGYDWRITVTAFRPMVPHALSLSVGKDVLLTLSPAIL